MKRHEQALLFLRKAAQDEALLDEVGDSANVSDEVIRIPLPASGRETAEGHALGVRADVS
jgi:hypothetical protein